MDYIEFEDVVEKERYTFTINFCALCIGLVGNTVVGMVIVCSRSLNTLTDFYLLSLAITDVLTLITKTLVGYYYYQCLANMELYLESGSDTVCRYVFHNRAADLTNGWICTTALYASVFTVTAFTIERYLAVCRPFVAQSMSETSRVKTVIASIWSFSALVVSLLLIIQITLKEIRNRILAGVLIKAARVAGLLFVVIPNLAIIVMYVLIARGLKRSSIERPMTLQNNCSNAKALKMFAIIIVTSFLSWVPYSVEIVLDTWPHYGEAKWVEFYLSVYRIRSITFTLPSVLNPIIYTIMSSKFRAALKELLLKGRKKLYRRTVVFTSAQTGETEMS